MTTHFTARVRLTKQPPEAVTVPALGCAGRTHHRSRRHLSPLLPRARVPGSGAGVVGWTSDCRPDGQRLAATIISPSELPTLMAPRLIELCFQTAGALGDGRARPHGSAAARSIASRLLRAPRSLADGPLIRRGHSRPGSRQASMQRLWMRKETATCISAATARWRFPNAVDAEPLKALQAAMSLEAVAA